MGKILSFIKGLDFKDWHNSANMTLEKKFILSVTVGLSLFFIIIGTYISSRITENVIRNEETSAIKELAAKDAALLSLERALKGKLLLLARNDALLRDGGDISRAFRKFTAENPEFTHIVFAKTDGEYFETPKFTREKHFDPRNTIWFKDAVAAGEGNMTLVMGPLEGLDGAARIMFYSIVNPWGEPYGVVGIGADFAKLFAMTGDNKNILVLDDSDTVVFEGEYKGTLFKKLQDANLGDLSLLGQKNEGISKCSVGGENMLAVVYKSSATKLKYIKLADENEVMKSAGNLRLTMFIAFFLAVCLAFFGSRLIMKRIKLSFQNIEKEAEALEAGRLDEVGALKESSDEVGRLSFAFGKLAGSVKSRLMTMETESQNLRAVLRDVLDRIEILKTRFNTLETMTAAAEKARESQGESARATAAEIEEIGKNFEDLAAEEEQAFKAVEDVDNGLRELEKLAEEKSAKFAEEATAAAAGLEGKLADISANMRDIFEKIEDTAGELTLHALSAAVEAARGKEEREKFAGIAEEVRKLAKSVESAAKEGKTAADAISDIKPEEYQGLDIKTGLTELIEKAKAAAEALKATEKIRRRLEAAGKSAKASAYDITLKEKEAAAAVKEAKDAIKTGAAEISEAEQTAKKVFE